MTYVTGFLTKALGIACHLVENQNERIEINYGNGSVEGAINIFASGLMAETGIRNMTPQIKREGPVIWLFPAPRNFNFPFDLLSAVFYLLSRYEEYLPYTPDHHGRFEAKQSISSRDSFLMEPVIDQWLEMLRSELKKKFPDLLFVPRKFIFRSTIDIDNPWAYAHRGILRSSGSIARDALRLNFRNILKRMGVYSGLAEDPFDVYDYINKTENRFGFQSVFFFLSGGYGQFDTNYSLHTAHFKNLVNKISRTHEVGIHPSLKSNTGDGLLFKEYQRFTRILGSRPQKSRQHFLMVKFPETYRKLNSLGIKNDYSMGYASSCGFRAGTTLPFNFYDLGTEQETNLVIHPFAIMDVTLRQYLNLNPAEALTYSLEILKKVKAVNGVFTILWHNESLSERGEWQGWRNVFEGIINESVASSE